MVGWGEGLVDKLRLEVEVGASQERLAENMRGVWPVVVIVRRAKSMESGARLGPCSPTYNLCDHEQVI